MLVFIPGAGNCQSKEGLVAMGVSVGMFGVSVPSKRCVDMPFASEHCATNFIAGVGLPSNVRPPGMGTLPPLTVREQPEVAVVVKSWTT